jgi:hypothetical protein
MGWVWLCGHSWVRTSDPWEQSKAVPDLPFGLENPVPRRFTLATIIMNHRTRFRRQALIPSGLAVVTSCAAVGEGHGVAPRFHHFKVLAAGLV